MRATLFLLLSAVLFSCSNPERSCNDDVSTTINNEPLHSPVKLQFNSLDGLQITANLYEIDKEAPTIILCHQARYNKFEYSGVAEVLNDKGFNCLAIDQRSGGPIASEQNETNLLAVNENRSVDFLDAEQDIRAAVDYAAAKYGKPVILWGSSYSSTLALYVAYKNPNVSGVISFSPGNYFANEKGSLLDILPKYDIPFFITSSLSEEKEITDLLESTRLDDKHIQFVPQHEGYHGSRALWPNQPNGDEYWKAINSFLKNFN